MPYKNMIKDVPDEVCNGCAQLYEGECRAFQMPHSEEERQARLKDPQLVCIELHPDIPYRSQLP